MPFPMRIQPIDSQVYRESSIRNDTVKPPVFKSRLKRLFDRPFNSVRISMTEKPAAGGEAAVPEFEPSSVLLDKMVQSFIEDTQEKQSAAAASAKYGRNRCNCFNANGNNSSDDELDSFFDSTTNSSFNDPSDTLKSLVPCASVVERNLLADLSKIVEKNKTCKRKDDLRKIVTDGLVSLGYNASICKSKWEKSSSIPAGEYIYIDVIAEGERLIIDIDLRSEFEIARSTSSYKGILQSLPNIFVGKPDRLLQIVSIVSEAARQSLKKKGMHIAPWRRTEYMKSKWFSPYTRIKQKLLPNDVVEMSTGAGGKYEPEEKDVNDDAVATEEVLEGEFGELDLIFGETDFEEPKLPSTPAKVSGEEEKLYCPPVMTWQIPVVKPKISDAGNKSFKTHFNPRRRLQNPGSTRFAIQGRGPASEPGINSSFNPGPRWSLALDLQ
ncbi:Hypothetical predicted protein [Olea europaea subsp. europaea]|uniref:Uncharacterized protein n=2 Tax=Olea europaea subsp. europaea TaxID=158383 RepID=A0A8S0PRQ3_OLEEU|nr:Hypothetical predicted protein [Olea europaea subsp. europaea]